MINSVVIQGRLARDPEIKTTQSGIAVANFTVCWSDKYKETETRLMNKLTAHYKPKDKGMTPAQAAAIPAVKDEPPAEAGKTYDELMTRLNLIKP